MGQGREQSLFCLRRILFISSSSVLANELHFDLIPTIHKLAAKKLQPEMEFATENRK